MLVNRTSFSRPLVVLCAATFVAFLGVGVGCSTSADDVPQGTTTTFYGMYGAAAGPPGTIDLTGISYPMTATLVQGTSPNSIPLSGSVTPGGGAAVSVTGAYDPDTGYIYFASADQSYSFTGYVVAGQCTGISYTPGGQGSFVLFLNGTAATSSTYCGTVLCTTPVDCLAYGSFNLVVSGSTALMTVNYNGLAGAGAGTVSGSTVHIDVVNTVYQVDIDIDGTLSGSNVTGTWTDNSGNGYAGTWSGSTAQCSAALVK